MQNDKNMDVAKIMFFWSYVLLTIVILGDGNIPGFTVNQSYIPMLQTIVVTLTVAFVGAVGIEKTTGIIQRKGLDEETYRSRSMDFKDV